jgi:hypothetical protein
MMIVAAACGGSTTSSSSESKKSAADIFADAKTAVTSASSYHVAGTADDNGDQLKFDVALSKGRSGGTIGTSGAMLQIVLSGGSLYLRGDAASWAKIAGNESVAQLAAGKWIKAPASSPGFKDLATTLDPAQLVATVSAQGRITKGPVTTINGQKAVPLVDHGDGGTLYVAATGTPYILKIVDSKASGSAGSLTFDQFGTATVPPVPTNAVDFSKFASG